MKRWIAIILVFAMCVSLTGCKTAEIMGRFAEESHKAIIGYFHDLKDYYKDQLHQAWVDITPDFMTKPAEMQHPTDIGSETLPDASNPVTDPQETVPGMGKGPLIDTGEPVTGPQETVPYEEPPAEEGFWPSLWDSVKEKGSSAWQACKNGWQSCMEGLKSYPRVEEEGGTVFYYNENKEKIDDATLDQFCLAKYKESRYSYLGKRKRKEILRLYCIYRGESRTTMNMLSDLDLVPPDWDRVSGDLLTETEKGISKADFCLAKASGLVSMVDFIGQSVVMPGESAAPLSGVELTEKCIAKSNEVLAGAKFLMHFNSMVSRDVKDPAEGCDVFLSLIAATISSADGAYFPGGSYYAELIEEIAGNLNDLITKYNRQTNFYNLHGILGEDKYQLGRIGPWANITKRGDQAPTLDDLWETRSDWIPAIEDDLSNIERRNLHNSKKRDKERALYLNTIKDCISFRIEDELSGKDTH